MRIMRGYRAPSEVLVPEGGGLLEREEDATDGRAERGRDAGGGAGAHEVALVDVVAEVREEPGEERDAALRDDRAHCRARVDHRALLRAHEHMRVARSGSDWEANGAVGFASGGARGRSERHREHCEYEQRTFPTASPPPTASMTPATLQTSARKLSSPWNSTPFR